MDDSLQLQPGSSSPLGAHWDGKGINFALAAPSAQSVTLCLFDEVGLEEKVRLPMPSVEDGVWSGYLPDASPGLVYAYRVSGEYAPEKACDITRTRFCSTLMHGRS